MNEEVPKAIKLYNGDVNAAVIAVQKATGVEINDAWWEANVGHQGTPEEILTRFDEAYAKYVASSNASKS